MSSITFGANSSTLILNGVVINDLGEGDVILFEFVNPKTTHVNSANGGVNIINTVNGDVVDLTVRVQALSDSDRYLNGIFNASTPVLLNGSCKTTYAKDGIEGSESINVRNGSITNGGNRTINNIDGAPLVEYKARFRQGQRI